MDSLKQPKEKKGMGNCPVMLLRRRLSRTFTLRRLCYVFGGTRSVIFIMSCWHRTKPSLGKGVERNWCVWAEHCPKNGHDTSRGTQKWFYSITTLGLSYQIRYNLPGNAQMGSPAPPASWIASKDEHFYCNGIRALLERWEKVVAYDGQYFEWFICNHFSTIKLDFPKKKQRELSCALNNLLKIFT